MESKSKDLIIYQVYDEEDPQSTDSFFDRIGEARKATYRMRHPSPIYTRRVKLTRAGICEALKTFPMR